MQRGDTMVKLAQSEQIFFEVKSFISSIFYALKLLIMRFFPVAQKFSFVKMTK